MVMHHLLKLSRAILRLQHQPEAEVTVHLLSILTAPEDDSIILKAEEAGRKRTR